MSQKRYAFYFSAIFDRVYTILRIFRQTFPTKDICSNLSTDRNVDTNFVNYCYHYYY